MKARVAELQKQARARLAALGKRPRLRVLLTGATGFLGKEILAQAAADPHVERGRVASCGPETIRDRKTKEVVRVLSAARARGAAAEAAAHRRAKRRARFRFVDGDIEKPDFGIDGRRARAAPARADPRGPLRGERLLRRHLRELVPRQRARLPERARVLARSSRRRRARASWPTWRSRPRTSTAASKRTIAQEDALVFPRHFYNNFYELTKAMASIETDRVLVEHGLRVAQLLPSIVIGHARTGQQPRRHQGA